MNTWESTNPATGREYDYDHVSSDVKTGEQGQAAYLERSFAGLEGQGVLWCDAKGVARIQCDVLGMRTQSGGQVDCEQGMVDRSVL
jgi:hypothetical protein